MQFFLILTFQIFLISCKNSQFASSTQKPADVKPTPTPAPVITPPIVPASPTPTPIVVSPTPAPSCTESLSYTPEDILCHIPVGSNTTWSNTTPWKTLSDAFVDRQAEWLSPLAQTTCGNNACCPFVPQTNKLLFVSNFTIAADGVYSYEVITDDQGLVKFWKNMSPTQVALTSTLGAGSKGTVTLTAGQYAVIVEATDISSAATGAVFSLRNNQNVLVKHTAQNDNWCIFRVANNENTETFVPSVASCKKCFGRP